MNINYHSWSFEESGISKLFVKKCSIYTVLLGKYKSVMKKKLLQDVLTEIAFSEEND